MRFEVFTKAEALKPGAQDRLEQKARKLTGAKDSAAPPAGRTVYGWHVAEGRADIFLTYCTNALAAQKQNPGQQIVDTAGRAFGRRRLRTDGDQRRAGGGAGIRRVHPVGGRAEDSGEPRLCAGT